MSIETPIGARVRVLDVHHKSLGLGRYQGLVDFDDEDNEIPYVEGEDTFGHPKILLDTGEIIYGIQCWWSEVDENFEVALAEVEKIGQPLQ
jgi:hypothetical protein